MMILNTFVIYSQKHFKNKYNCKMIMFIKQNLVQLIDI